MRIILLGAPGAGKGTQATILSKNMNLPHISKGTVHKFFTLHMTEIG